MQPPVPLILRPYFKKLSVIVTATSGLPKPESAAMVSKAHLPSSPHLPRSYRQMSRPPQHFTQQLNGL
nr:hypothetical protein HmN_000326800 [Hymenolepis microstoma]